MKSILVISFSLILSTGYTQSVNTNWRDELNGALQKFLSCVKENSGGTTCENFTGKSLNTIYNVNDFYLQPSKRYMTGNEISAFLKESKTWTTLGATYDQKTLEKAQEFANAKKAVVAVYRNQSGVGHVVVITPGKLQPSGSWGLNVPNAASFLAVQPDKSFVDKALSFAFAKNMIKDVFIYVRSY